jgi:hypothetical protein
MTTTTAKAALGAALAAAALALTACTGGTPTPTDSGTKTSTATQTPTQTSSAVAAPASQDQALQDAMNAVKKYGSTLEEITHARSTDTTPLESVAQGAALTFAKEFVASAAKSTTKYTGSTVESLQSGYASKSTIGNQDFEFGFADMKVCEDSSHVEGVKADGTPERKSDHLRMIVQYGAQYNPATKSWFVISIKQDGVVPC